jgi:hypothetical protein
MLRSPVKHVINIIKYLNTNNAILSKINADLVAILHAYKKTKKDKQIINKARFLSKADINRLRAEQEAKNTANIAYKQAAKLKKY